MRRLFVPGFAIVASCLFSLPVSAQRPFLDPRVLPKLIQATGVSGFESEVRDLVRENLPGWAKSRVDEIGNLVVTVGQGAPHVLVCASMDEDGYFVSGITDDGYLRVHRVTTGVTNRLFEQMHYGQPMFVRTQTGKRVPGVFATASTHLQRGRDQAVAPPKTLDDLWVDVGASSRREIDDLGVRMLDPVSLLVREESLGPDIVGPAAQTRAYDYALADFLWRLDPASIRGTLTIAWTVQGSFGDRGMARLAQQVKPDRVIVLARTAMPREGGDLKGAVGRLGGGPLVDGKDARSLDLAKQRGLTVQATAGLRASNAWPPEKVQALALPVLYAQTPVETVNGNDIKALPSVLGLIAGLPLKRAALGLADDPLEALPPPPPLVQVLWPLVQTTGVSGAEGPVREAILKQLPKWAKPEIDQKGNVTITFGPASAKQLLFVAHMDEIGYAITGILEDGTATVAKRGGFFDYLWEAHPVFVQTTPHGTKFVPAIVAPRPNYLTASTATPKPEDIVLYFGTNSRAETEALGVKKGDTATIGKQLTQLAGSRWTARSMDDRCGVAAMIEALKEIDPAKVPNRVTFAFVTGEETGLEGSGFLAERLHPGYTFAIDTFVSSDSPVDPQRMALVPLGSGVVARAIDNSVITPPDTVARVVAIGKAHQVPVIPSATSGGNDGSRFTPYGSIVMPLSWPGRYSHSPVEVMDLRDLEYLVRLTVALAREF